MVKGLSEMAEIQKAGRDQWTDDADEKEDWLSGNRKEKKLFFFFAFGKK